MSILGKIGRVVAKPVTYPAGKVRDAAQLFQIYSRAQTLLDLFQGASVSKSLFTSKIFWFNVITAVLQFAEVIPLPVEYTALIVAVCNVGLRLITKSPTHVLAPKE